MRIVIIGENSSVQMGGEASTPFFLFKFLRERGVEAWLVAHGRVGDELRRLLPEDFHRVRLVADTRLDKFLVRASVLLPERVRDQTISVLEQLITQYRMKRVAARLVADERIDIIHQAYPISPKIPSAIHDLGAPVVIGPLSGGMDFPPSFRGMEGRAARLVQWFGRRAADAVNRLVPGKIRAASLIVTNPRTRAALPRGVRGVVYEENIEVSVNLEVFQYDEQMDIARRCASSIRFVYLGRLIALKGVELLLQAFRRALDAADALALDLEILGDGPERVALESCSARLGLTERVHFAGWVGAEEAALRLKKAHVFVLPSLRESGGIVLIEAMALGLPVITTRWGGPEMHVDDATGIRVEPSSREGFISGLTEAIIRLARSPALRDEMGRAARQRVQSGYYTWERKIDRILEIYNETLARRTARPDCLNSGPGQPAVGRGRGDLRP